MAARIRRTSAQWQQLVQEQQSSGLSVSEFCTKHSLTESTFYLQRKKYREVTESAGLSESWLPLNELMHVEQDNRHWQIELKLPNGVVLTMRTDSLCC